MMVAIFFGDGKVVGIPGGSSADGFLFGGLGEMQQGDVKICGIRVVLGMDENLFNRNFFSRLDP